MADLKTQLEIGVDGSGVEAGVNKIKKSLVELGDAGGQAGQRGAAGLDKMGAAGDQTAKKLDQATKNLISNAQRNLAAIEAGVEANGRMSGKFIESLARQRGADVNVLRPFIKDLDEAIAKQKIALGQNAQLTQRGSLSGVTTSLGATGFSRPLPANLGTSLGATAFGEIPATAGKAAAAISDFNRTFGAAGLTAKQTTAALRQVPAQLTDIFVSLQGGQAPLTVLLQQGGQLKDVFGGIGPAARALGGYVVGLINPFTLAAAAAAALALAYNQGSKEADAYAKALILTGNAAGSNVNQLNAMAKAISTVTGTQSQAAEAVAAFAANGNIAANSIERFAKVAVQLERTAGQAVGETVKQFSELGKEPLQASIKLNETTRFLTTSLYQQVKALEEQGKTAEAAAAAQRGFADAMESRTGQLETRLGSIERGWRNVKDAAAAAWSAMLNVGRADTLNDQLDEAQRKLTELQGRGALGARAGRRQETTNAEIEATKQAIYGLNERLNLEGKSAQLQSDEVRRTKSRIDFDKEGVQYLDKKLKLEQEIAKARNLGLAAGASPQEIEKRVGDIRAKFADKPKSTASTERALDRSELNFDLSKIKSQADELVRIYSDAERVLEALRSGGLVDEKDYYDSRRQFLALETEAKERAYTQEIGRLGQEKLKGKEAIDNSRKIAEAETQLAILRARNSSRAVILDLEERNAAKQKADALTSARQAAEAYLDSQNRQQGRLLQAFGQGPREAALAAGINQIDDNFSGQRRELENLKVLGRLTQDEYENRLAIIKEFQSASLQSFTDYYNRLLELQGNAALGATAAVKSYMDEAANVKETTQEFFSNTFKGLEDSLTRFLTTGKGGFKEFADSIVSDITRIIVKQQIANALAGAMGSGGIGGFAGDLFGALMGSTMGGGGINGGTMLPNLLRGGRSDGGSVSSGGLYRVNEQGPELLTVGNRDYLMMGNQSGRVEPAQSGQREAMTVVNNFTLSGSVDRRTQLQIAAAAGRGVQTAMARNT